MTLKRPILFVAVSLLAGPFIFMGVEALCIGLQTLITVPITTSPERLAADFPLAVAAIVYLAAIAAIVGGVLISPITFAVGVTLAIVDGYDLARAVSRRLKITQSVASDIIAFFVGGLAAVLAIVLSQDFQAVGGFELMSRFTASPSVSYPTVGLLPMSAFCGGIAAAVCNRIAIACGESVASQRGTRVP